MIRAVADTHTLIWHIFDDPRMSPAATAVFDAASAAGDQVAVSSISLVEVAYLIERRRIDPTAFGEIRARLGAGGILVEAVVDQGVADALRSIPRDQVPDMPDRIIAATALKLAVPLVSRDGKIRASAVATIW